MATLRFHGRTITVVNRDGRREYLEGDKLVAVCPAEAVEHYSETDLDREVVLWLANDRKGNR